MKDYKLARLISVLTIAAILVVLALLVASVTSCAPAQNWTAPTVNDGTIYHPFTLDAPGDKGTWQVLTESGSHSWQVNQVFAGEVRANMYILYNGAEYQVSGVNVKQHTLSAVIMGN
jgi:hypothetical protein